MAACSIRKMRWDIWRIFFSDFRNVFFPLGGVCHKSYESKYHSIYKKKIFWDPFCLWQTPPSRFLVLYPLKLIFVNSFLRFPIFGVLREPPPKKIMCYIEIGREINFQSWTFRDSFFFFKWQPLLHSALCEKVIHISYFLGLTRLNKCGHQL